MIQVGTELEVPIPSNLKAGDFVNVRKNRVIIEGATIFCQVESRDDKLVLVVVDVLQDNPLQEEPDKAYLIYDTVKP